MDLSTICSFTRMQALLFSKVVAKPEQIPHEAVQQVGRLQPAALHPAACLQKAAQAQVADALAASGELQLSEDRKRIRRVKPLDPEQATAEVDARSIYASPFPSRRHPGRHDALLGRRGAHQGRALAAPQPSAWTSVAPSSWSLRPRRSRRRWAALPPPPPPQPGCPADRCRRLLPGHQGLHTC